MFDNIGRSSDNSRDALRRLGNTIIDSIINNLNRAGDEALSLGDILDSVFRGLTGGGGGIGDGILNLFGGSFQRGGTLPPNRVSFVGERGTEAVIPPGSGFRVIPNNQLGGSTIVNNIRVDGSVDDRALRALERAVARGTSAGIQRDFGRNSTMQQSVRRAA